MGRNAEAIAEGVAIAMAAARLTVKNEILVGTISLDETFEPDHFVPGAREALQSLAEEQEQAAAAITKARRAAWGRHSQPAGTHDYRDRDVRNLRRRAKQYTGVAKELRASAEDDTALHELVSEARDAAWHDVESNLNRRLRVEAFRPDEDPDYATMRDARMQALRLVDLQRLAADVRSRRKRSETDAAPMEPDAEPAESGAESAAEDAESEPGQ